MIGSCHMTSASRALCSEGHVITKTIIFVNTVADIRSMINIIIGWIKNLGYTEVCEP